MIIRFELRLESKKSLSDFLKRVTNSLSRRGWSVYMIYCCGGYYNPSQTVFLLPDNNYRDRKLEIVICCGGDGTLNDLINAVMELDKKPQISFIPLGTINDFANTINLFRYKFFVPNNIQHIITKYRRNTDNSLLLFRLQ